MRNKKTITTVLPYIAIMLFSIMLTGVVELIEAKFDFTYLLTADYWSNMVVSNISAFLMAFSSTLMAADIIYQKTDSGLGKEAYDLEEAVLMGSTNINNDIDIMIAEENQERKKKAWVKKIRGKIIKIERKFKEKDISEYAEILKDKNLETISLDNLRKLVKKKIKLERLIQKDYIESNLPYIKVKYYKITRMMIENGQDYGRETEARLSKKGRVLMYGIAPKFIYSTAIMMFILSFKFEKANISIGTLIPLFSKIITLIFNANFGKNFAPTYFKETVIHDLKLHKEWITKYMEWRKTKEPLE